MKRIGIAPCAGAKLAEMNGPEIIHADVIKDYRPSGRTLAHAGEHVRLLPPMPRSGFVYIYRSGKKYGRGIPSWHLNVVSRDECSCQTEQRDEEVEPLNYQQFNVLAERCNECLFSPDAIVDAESRQGIIEDCKRVNTFFICHKATEEGNLKICCKGFYDSQDTLPVALAKALKNVRFIPIADLRKHNPKGRKQTSPDIAFLRVMQGKQPE